MSPTRFHIRLLEVLLEVYLPVVGSIRCVRARQPRNRPVVSISEFVTRPPFITRWIRACLWALLLALANLPELTT
jgi:hypothetical protein